jgi:hypothetical protein
MALVTHDQYHELGPSATEADFRTVPGGTARKRARLNDFEEEEVFYVCVVLSPPMRSTPNRLAGMLACRIWSIAAHR